MLPKKIYRWEQAHRKMLNVISHQRNAPSTTVRRHCTPTRTARIKKSRSTKAGEDTEMAWTWRGQSFWKRVWQFLLKKKCNPGIALLDISPREMKTYVHKKTCSWAFTAALFVIAKYWKLSTYSSTVKWVHFSMFINILYRIAN